MTATISQSVDAGLLFGDIDATQLAGADTDLLDGDIDGGTLGLIRLMAARMRLFFRLGGLSNVLESTEAFCTSGQSSRRRLLNWEVAINTDVKAYIKNADGQVVQIAGADNPTMMGGI